MEWQEGINTAYQTKDSKFSFCLDNVKRNLDLPRREAGCGGPKRILSLST